MKPRSFYSHIGGWEDEYAVAKQCEKIVCDDWETLKHPTQTLSRMYKDGELKDEGCSLQSRRSGGRREAGPRERQRVGLLQRRWVILCRCRDCLGHV